MFGFNAYSGLLLPAVLQGFVFATILLVRQREFGRDSDGIAAALLLVGALHVAQWMLGFAGWYDSRDWQTTVMFYVEWSHLAALGPLLYFYFLAVTNADFHWRTRYGWHFLPAAAFCIPPALMVVYDFGIHAGLLGRPFEFFGGTRGPAMEFEHTSLAWLDAAEDYFVYPQLAVYLAITARAYRRFRTYVASEFANARDFSLSGLRNLLLIFVVGAVVVVSAEVAAYWLGAGAYTDSWWRFFAMGLVVFTAAVQFHALHPRHLRALRFPTDATTPAPEVRLTPKPLTRPSTEEASSATQPQDARLLDRLAARLAEHGDYLEPDLRLAELAKRLGTNAGSLSRVVNAHYGTNFSDYLNGLRCEAFLSRLRAGEHERHTLLSLALDSGFNSKSTFNRAFRKRYGYPPGQAAARLQQA